MQKDDYIQYLRALSILAVILIHVLPSGGYSIEIRQFINFPVGIFLFLSGYLTTERSVIDTKKFYKRRITRVFIPYVIWSFVFIVYHRDFNIKSILIKLITGQACVPYYYILVYIQLILLTPLMFKMLNRKIIYLITPAFLCVLYAFTIIGYFIPFPYNAVTFFSWIIFYFYGLRLRNLNLIISLNKNILFYCIFIVLSIIEGHFWNKQGEYSLAISQLKITSMFTTIFFINIIIGIKDKINYNSNILKIIGDYSFGMYLTHYLFLYLIGYKLNNIIIRYIAVVIITLLFVIISKKILGEKLSRVLGFE